MKVKVGDKVYDSNEEPILLVMSVDDKVNIMNMPKEATKYCSFPDSMTVEEGMKWMKSKE